MDIIAARREEHVADLARNLESVVQQLASLPAVQKVILFGSYAAGRRDLFTDLDLLVIMESDLEFLPRNIALARQVHATVAMDLMAYTPEEIERMRDRPFIRHALKTGKVVYEKGPSE